MVRFLAFLLLAAVTAGSAAAGPPKDCMDRCKNELGSCINGGTDPGICQNTATSCADYCVSLASSCVEQCSRDYSECVSGNNPEDYCSNRYDTCAKYYCSTSAAEPSTSPKVGTGDR